MASTANVAFRDAMISHQIALLRLSGTINNKIVQLLDASEAELRDMIVREIDKIANTGDITAPATLRRLQTLADSIGTLRQAAINDALDEWTNQMRDLAYTEPAFVAAKLNSVMPVLLDLVLPAPALLRSLVTSQPFMGQTMKEWSQSLAEADLQRIMNEIRIGMVQGQTTPQIAARIVGTAQLNGTNGVTQITRNQATAITRTAVNFFANAARQEFFRENADIFEVEQFVATLDSRTTPICRSLDGKQFKVGEGPIPPIHWGCRSIRVAVVTDQLIGTRPFNPTTEQELLDEFTSENNLDPVSSRDDLPYGYKTKFDAFASARTRELIGRVPAATTYAEFLSRQSVAFQEEVLGKVKAALFRKGDLTLDRFVDRNSGKELTLRQLVLRDREAFLKAGLNPDDYL